MVRQHPAKVSLIFELVGSNPISSADREAAMVRSPRLPASGGLPLKCSLNFFVKRPPVEKSWLFFFFVFLKSVFV